jgi:hypothetical protein
MAATAVLGAAALAAAQTPAADDPRDLNLTAYVELLRADVRAQKVAFLTELMALTEAEDEKFWPIYREYDVELSALQDERAAMIREYAATAGAVTDAQAEAIGAKAIDIDRRRTALLEKYHGRVKAALSPRAALRFLQVEHQLLLIIDLQIASFLPVVR